MSPSVLSNVCSRTSPVWMFPVSEEALSETAESTSDEVVMDVLAETEETVLTGTEDAAPVQADNKTVKAGGYRENHAAYKITSQKSGK